MKAGTETALRYAQLLGITPAAGERRKSHVRLGAEDAGRLKDLRVRLRGALPDLVAGLLARLRAQDEGAFVFPDSATLEPVRQALLTYCDTLTCGEYGWVYVLDRLGLGVTFQRLGVPVHLQASGFAHLVDALLPDLFRLFGREGAGPVETVRALMKVVFFDFGLILEAYRLADQQASDRLRASAEASERRYQDLVEGLDAIVYEADAETRGFTFVSVRAEAILGYPAERLVERRTSWLDLLHPEDRERTVAAYRAAVAETRDCVLEYRAMTAEGRVVWLQDSVHVALDVPGRPRHVRGLMLDVTRRKREEQALRFKTDQLQAMTHAMTVSLQGADWQETSSELVREALRVTGSACGFAAVRGPGAALRLLASIGIPWEATPGGQGSAKPKDCWAGGICPAIAALRNVAGAALRGTAPVPPTCVLALPDGVRGPERCPPPCRFLGVPILKGSEPVGLLGVANRPGEYGEQEQAALELLARTAGVLFDRYERMEHEEALQQQLQQSQKMESLGLLAGGISHDFNNLLSAIIGFSELMTLKLDPHDPMLAYAQEIHGAGQSAAALTRQLLAFSRRQHLVPEIIDLNEVITRMEVLLRRTIGEHIQVVKSLGPDLGRVRADRGQIEQVLMNLAVNARDAMPAGGRLALESANVDLSAPIAAHHIGAQPGPYVMLTVTDTGCGMDERVKAHLFEPFFTTKEMGKGTGLGLPMVYGIVKQSGGTVWVYSEPGQGTTFRIYLPRVEAGAAAPGPAGGKAERLTGTETILVVDDADMVRRLAAEVLRGLGYTVLEAKDPAEALRVCQRPGAAAAVRLLLTDVVMPGMRGYELARRLIAASPALKVVYMSGYTDSDLSAETLQAQGAQFLQKPLCPDTLARVVREFLDGAGAAMAAPA